MRAVILVGGFGTRLRPLTTTRPKQMLPLVHRPMIEHVCEHLAAHGVTDAALSLGYRPDAFSARYRDSRCGGVSVHYAVEPEPLDTAGAIRFAALDAGIDERFVVVNGDIITDLDLGRVLDFHDASGGEGTIVLHPVEDPSAFGVVPTDEAGRVEAFVEKPPAGEAPTNLINAGTYVLEPSVIGRIADGRRVSVEREVFPAMVADRSLFAVDGETYWLDAGTPAAYLQAHLDLLDGRRGEAPEATHRSALVGDGATVGRSVISAGAVVEPGARVTDSVLFPGCHVAGGAVIVRSILGESVKVGEGAEISDLSVLGDGEIVAPGEHLVGERRPAPPS